MIWPPITMATQHPDNAVRPWWRESAFVPTQDEIDELLLLFKELPIDEYMWDWEGKYVDEAVGEKLFSRANDFFSQKPLGEDVHLTYRIPALDGEKMHRLTRALMNVLALADLGSDLGLKRPPVIEMFLPLTTKADQPMRVRQAFREIAAYHRSVFHTPDNQKHEILDLFEVTPLVEDVDSLNNIEAIIRPYWESLIKEGKDLSRGQRLFLARSDPAMNAGLVPAVLALKAALSRSAEIGEELGFPVYPIIGTGSLPFRGHVSPDSVDLFLDQYAGVRTYSIQSAFRYDYPKDDVRKALEKIRREAPLKQVVRCTAEQRAKITETAEVFTAFWRPTIEAIATHINNVASFIPPRRERLQHIGLFGYSRGVGAVKLPRAIGFTCSLYSLGVPPELVATGRGLRAAKEKGLLDTVERTYPTLRQDLMAAGQYLNRENLDILAARESAFADIKKDIEGIEDVLGITLGPKSPRDIIHRNITSSILQRIDMNDERENITRDLVEAATIRRSLG